MQTTTSQQLAREIMGTNFFGVEEAIKHLEVKPTEQQLAALAEVPWSREVLYTSRNTHVLLAVFPVSILDIRRIAQKQSGQTLFHRRDCYEKQAFAEDKGEVDWQLVRKEPIVSSRSKTWNDQQTLLSKDEETPTARIVVYTMFGHLLSTEKRLFENFYVRCADLDSGGRRVYVGFVLNGFRVFSGDNNTRDDSIGLAAARKK